MTTLTVDIKNDEDLPVITGILNRFGASYKTSDGGFGSADEEKLHRRLKKAFVDIKDWEAGKMQLQNAREALEEIKAELVLQGLQRGRRRS